MLARLGLENNMPRGATTLSRLGIALSFFLASWLAGCGQTGPLYLPADDQPEQQQEAQQEQESEEEQATQAAPE
jgi:predicted small lipoprotein YifL